MECFSELEGTRAEREGLNTLFIKRDARNTDLPDEKFKVVIVMASSFGYFEKERENEKILREIFRLLMPGGHLLLDLPNRDFVVKNFSPQSWHEANEEIVVCRQRRLETDVLYVREMVLSKKRGWIREENYCTRLYGQDKIREMLRVGFSLVSIHNDYASHEKKDDYGCMTNRMAVIAYKG